jgi:hypothetical protein
MRRHLTILCCLCSVLVPGCAQQGRDSARPAEANSKVLAIGDLTWQEFDALNRERDSGDIVRLETATGNPRLV